jgi:hypothetical protein
MNKEAEKAWELASNPFNIAHQVCYQDLVCVIFKAKRRRRSGVRVGNEYSG